MIAMQLINDSLTAVVIAVGMVILAVIWVLTITAAADMNRRRAIRHVQQAATAITAAAASPTEAAAR
jgi:VIT1/CCC1 family predicted Fe2+/Mn2+ transporter